MDLTDTEQWIVSYLQEHKEEGFISPTDIGYAYGGSAHSAWASPKCLKLVDMGYLERSDKGWYRLKQKKKKWSLGRDASGTTVTANLTLEHETNAGEPRVSAPALSENTSLSTSALPQDTTGAWFNISMPSVQLTKDTNISSILSI